MTVRKRRANAWAGLYAGLVGVPARDEESTPRGDEQRRAERSD